MDEQRREGHEVSSATWAKVRELRAVDEVWIHCGWLPCLWWAAVVCFLTQRRRGAECAERILKWMPEACYDPVRLKYHGWKKWLAGPIERWCLRRCDRIVATCEAEKGWIEKYLGKRCPVVEVTDIKRFFDFSRVDGLTQRRRGAECAEMFSRVEHVERVEGRGFDSRVERVDRVEDGGSIGRVERVEKGVVHLLYLGRRHPLKGVGYLEEAVRQLNSNLVNPVNPVQNSSTRSTCSTRLNKENSSLHVSTRSTRLKIVSSAFGEELEKVWDWCDVLVLPTLSDNFGLVIAEALERGKRVITTDGAPAWGEELTGLTGFTGLYSGYGGRLVYLKGYRDGTDEERVELLKKAIDMLKHDGNMV